MYRLVLVVLANVLLAGWSSAARADGGPDDFGYAWTDSVTGTATYAWVDVVGDPNARELVLGDDDAVTVDIGFAFTFYGQSHDRVLVHSNGFLTFEDTREELMGIAELCAIPRTNDIDGAISLYARDWNPVEGGTVHVLTTGSEPNRAFVVQFTGVPRWSDEGGLVEPMTVEAILHEGTNDIDVQVRQTDDSAGGNGLVGIESPDGLSGLAYPSCLAQGSVPAELAVHFAYPATEIAVVPRRQQRADVADSDSSVVFAVYDRGASDVTLPIAVTSEWAITTVPADEIVVPAGGSAELVVTVAIPAEAAPGDTRVATVRLGGAANVDLTVTTGVQRPVRGAFQRVADMPRADQELVVGVTDEAVWTAGGRAIAGVDYVVLDSVARYDVATDTWTSSDDGALAPLPEPRFLAAGCVLGGHLYVIGGFDDVRMADTTLDYDIVGDVWAARAPLPEPRALASAVCDADGGRIFVFGGLTTGDGGALDDALEVLAYDATADAWTAAGTLTASRQATAVGQVDADTIVLAGGFYDGRASAVVEAYDVPAQTFTSLLALPDARTHGVGAVLDGQMCVVSGHAAGLDRGDWLCLAGDMWITERDALPTPVLPGGGGVADQHLYVVGGQDAQGDATNAVQRWPPESTPDGDADADADADTDGDADAGDAGDADADAGPGGHGGDDGCCAVTPGAPAHDDRGLLVLAVLLVGAWRRAGQPSPRR